MARVSRKELMKFLEKEGLPYLKVPKTFGIRPIEKAIMGRGFKLTPTGKLKLREAMPLIRKEGVGSIQLLGEKWRRQKELKIETKEKEPFRSSYAFYIPLQRRR
jgi:hypothetical protein